MACAAALGGVGLTTAVAIEVVLCVSFGLLLLAGSVPADAASLDAFLMRADVSVVCTATGDAGLTLCVRTI
jgi:hypothetical protein